MEVEVLSIVMVRVTHHWGEARSGRRERRHIMWVLSGLFVYTQLERLDVEVQRWLEGQRVTHRVEAGSGGERENEAYGSGGVAMVEPNRRAESDTRTGVGRLYTIGAYGSGGATMVGRAESDTHTRAGSGGRERERRPITYGYKYGAIGACGSGGVAMVRTRSRAESDTPG